MTGSDAVKVCIVLTGLAFLAVLAWQAGAEVTPHVISLTTPVPSESLANTEPGLVRIVALPERSASGQKPDMDSAQRIVDVQHLGALTGQDLVALKSSCAGYLSLMQENLASRRGDSVDSKELLEDAQRFLMAETAKAAVKAVDQGSYLILAQSDPQQLTLPGAEVLATGGMRDGQQVNVSIVMSLEAFPALRVARDYLNDMQSFDDSEKARRFNELPDQERSQLAARIRELQAKLEKSRADREFLKECLGSNTRLGAGGNLLYSFPVK